MSYVFDAGSILLLTRELGKNVVDVVKEQVTASLAFYEIGNALWKECCLLGRLRMAEAEETLSFIHALMTVMKVLDVREDSGLGKNVLANAAKLKITYYDSAYLTLAERFKAILVTDDGRLAKASRKIGIKVLTAEELMSREGRINARHEQGTSA